jgi:hypothetical protein
MLHEDGKLQLLSGRINPPISIIGRPGHHYRRWSQLLAANRSRQAASDAESSEAVSEPILIEQPK